MKEVDLITALGGLVQTVLTTCHGNLRLLGI